MNLSVREKSVREVVVQLFAGLAVSYALVMDAEGAHIRAPGRANSLARWALLCGRSWLK